MVRGRRRARKYLAKGRCGGDIGGLVVAAILFKTEFRIGRGVEPDTQWKPLHIHALGLS